MNFKRAIWNGLKGGKKRDNDEIIISKIKKNIKVFKKI